MALARPADQQLQCFLFSLPLELRVIIYRLAILDGASSQHVVWHQFHRGRPASRIACFPVRDEEYWRSAPEEEFRLDVPNASDSEWRDGHWRCRRDMIHQVKNLAPQVLKSPVALFQSCRRIYEEAIDVLYKLRFSGYYPLISFLECAPVATLDRIREIDFSWASTRSLNPLHAHRELQTVCGRLANLKGLQSLRIHVCSDIPLGSRTIPETTLKILSWIKAERLEIILSDLPLTEEDNTEELVLSNHGRCLLRRKRKLSWSNEPVRIISNGATELAEMLSEYSQT